MQTIEKTLLHEHRDLVFQISKTPIKNPQEILRHLSQNKSYSALAWTLESGITFLSDGLHTEITCITVAHYLMQSVEDEVYDGENTAHYLDFIRLAILLAQVQHDYQLAKYIVLRYVALIQTYG